MIKKEDVETKVRRFLQEEFPEVWTDIKDTGCPEEFAELLYEMLVGEFQEEE